MRVHILDSLVTEIVKATKAKRAGFTSHCWLDLLGLGRLHLIAMFNFLGMERCSGI